MGTGKSRLFSASAGDWQISALYSKCRRTLVSWVAPSGKKWTGHGVRSGGTSACQAIDVALFFYIMSFGVWKSMEAMQRFLSASSSRRAPLGYPPAGCALASR